MLILKSIVGILGIALSLIFRGYVISYYFKWFFVPLGLPPINIPTGIGISILMGMLTYQFVKTEPGSVTLLDSISRSMMISLFCLFSGFITFQFV